MTWYKAKQFSSHLHHSYYESGLLSTFKRQLTALQSPNIILICPLFTITQFYYTQYLPCIIKPFHHYTRRKEDRMYLNQDWYEYKRIKDKSKNSPALYNFSMKNAFTVLLHQAM